MAAAAKDPEFKALESSLKTLTECDEEARERILHYLVARFLPGEELRPRTPTVADALSSHKR